MKKIIVFLLLGSLLLIACGNKKVKGIEFNKDTVYSYENEFDYDKVKIDVTYENNEKETITLKESMLSSSDANLLKGSGRFEVTITYNNFILITFFTIYTNNIVKHIKNDDQALFFIDKKLQIDNFYQTNVLVNLKFCSSFYLEIEIKDAQSIEFVKDYNFDGSFEFNIIDNKIKITLVTGSNLTGTFSLGFIYYQEGNEVSFKDIKAYSIDLVSNEVVKEITARSVIEN